MYYEEDKLAEVGPCGFEWTCREGFGQTLDPVMGHKCGAPFGHKGQYHRAWVKTNGRRHLERVPR